MDYEGSEAGTAKSTKAAYTRAEVAEDRENELASIAASAQELLLWEETLGGVGFPETEPLPTSLAAGDSEDAADVDARLQVLAEDAAWRVYVCGPTPMMAKAAELAAARGRDCVASLENPMACGFGVCLGCAAPLREGGFALVCRDGPVFDAARIAWEGLP